MVARGRWRDREAFSGGVAQLGERLVCNQEAIGSIPFTSTTLSAGRGDGRRRPETSGPVFRRKGRNASRLSLFDNRFRRRPKFFHALSSGQANKGARWMPWRQEATKDVAGCDKLR